MRFFGAPVTDAQGNSAARSLGERGTAAGGHGRGHLQERRVALDLEERGHLHAADLGHLPEVVPQHVHDHQVLGPLLLRLAQAGGLGLVLLHGDSPRRRPLHRPRGEEASLEAEEELRRGARHREAAEVHERRVAGPLRRQQPGEERERLLGERRAEREGEVDLVGVAPGDALVDAGEGPGVAGLVERGLPARGRGRGARVGPRRLDLARRFEDPEPDERGPVGIGRPRREAEGRRRLVGHEARHESARGERRVRLLEGSAHARRVTRLDRGERRLEQQEAAAVLDEGERRGRRGLWAHGLRAS